MIRRAHLSLSKGDGRRWPKDLSINRTFALGAWLDFAADGAEADQAEKSAPATGVVTGARIRFQPVFRKPDGHRSVRRSNDGLCVAGEASGHIRPSRLLAILKPQGRDCGQWTGTPDD